MSAIGDRIAIVSLGLSCQTSRQIDGHVPLLRQLTGDEGLEKTSLPFDWLISTPAGLAGLIEDRLFFPETQGELQADQDRLRLRAHDVLYWHVSRLAARVGHPCFEDAKAKFAYLSARFEQIAKMDRVVAVISNTQPNLPWKEEKWNIPLTGTTVEEADHVRQSFANHLNRPVELLMVSRNEKHQTPLPADFAFYHMVPEADGWAGDGRKWAAVFKDYFGEGQ